MRRRICLALALSGILGLAGPASAQQLFDIEFGYRFADVTGNDQTYRSQVNERSGFVLRALSLGPGDQPVSGIFDTYRLDVSDLGSSPASSVRFSAGKTDVYKLRFSFTRAEHFSALAGFANPLLAQGILPGQHTIRRTREMLDADVEILPGGVVTPIVGYSRNRYQGPGQSTYTVGGDEFRLSQHLAGTEHEVRVGAGFQVGPVAGHVLQGWRKFEETETLDLAPGAGGGNSGGTLLDRPVNLSDFSRTSETDANTPFTSAVASARFGPVKLVGSYVRARAESDTGESESLTGSLVSFQLSRYFSGLDSALSSRAKSLNWRAMARAEVQVGPNIDVTAGYTRRHRELDGLALLDTLFLGTTTFSGFDARDVRELLESETSLERTEDIYEVRATARNVGPFRLSAAWGQIDQDIVATPDPSEIVIPGGQGGDFSRQIRHFDAMAALSTGDFTFDAQFWSDDADQAVVRTDFEERKRYRIRLGWSGLSWLSLTGTARETLDDRTTAGYDARLTEYGGELTLRPLKVLSARFGLTRYEANSHILIRLPQNFTTTDSSHRERGTAFEGMLSLALGRIALDGGYSRFDNTGTSPFVLERLRSRVDVGVWKAVGLVGEYSRDKYLERLLRTANYRSNRFGLFVRYRP